VNNARREEIQKAIDKMGEIKSDFENILSDEEEYKDNIPENLQGSQKYSDSEDAVNYLQEVIEYLDEALSSAEAAQA
jgi:hypothetical protein